MSLLAFGMSQIECCNCGIIFAITKERESRLRETKENFYCPSGHQQAYVRSQLDAEKAKTADLQRQLEWERARCRQEEKSRISLKGQLTKVKNRIANGVCPCCNRSFTNIARHIKTKHPKYRNEE